MFPDASNVESDISTWFEKLWRDLEEFEMREANSGPAYRKVCLECNGELVEIASVVLVGLRESALGAELIEFVCPRCGQRHESLRFR